MDPLVIGIPSANRCKNLYNFVDFCIRKQNFAELTPVHRFNEKVSSRRQARKIG
jgi:hypothetical protein